MNNFVLEGICQQQVKVAVKNYRYTSGGKKKRVANMNSYLNRKQFKVASVAPNSRAQTVLHYLNRAKQQEDPDALAPDGGTLVGDVQYSHLTDADRDRVAAQYAFRG